MSVGGLRDLEQGRITAPRPDTLRSLAAGLALSRPDAAKLAWLSQHDQPATGELRVQVLGPLVVWVNGVEVDPGSVRPRALLGRLALTPNVPVPLDTLIESAWGPQPPAGAADLTRTHMSRLRRRLRRQREPGDPSGDVVIASRGGYQLTVTDDQLDLLEFQRCVEQARRARTDGELDSAAEWYQEATGLWRGEPLADVPSLRTEPALIALEREWRTIVVEYADSESALGRYHRVLPLLRQVTEADPVNEAAHGWLMIALAGSGEAPAALAVYDQLRRCLADELGIDPSSDLQELHRSILRDELRPSTAAPAPRAVPAGREVPAQLPVDVRGITGRTDELAELDAILAMAGEQPTAAVIVAISGTAGAGKTALAVHWAHRVADQFPDGQLYVNLRGFDSSVQAMEPAEAIRGFLDAFAVPPQRVPARLDAQAALYRSLLAGQRVLVVLDNARDADQIRPLLPGSPGCLVVVTSRNQLTSLVATEGAHPLALDLLTANDARHLLALRLGPRRVAAEPEAVSQIIVGCARLPLALCIVAARAATHPTFSLATLAGELQDSQGRLDALASGHANDIRAIFSWSYRTLSQETARLFRLLGLHPGSDIAAPAAASLAGTGVRPLLAELAQAQLIVEHAPGRYMFHDLLHAYATELAHSVDSEAERHAALRRVLDYYLHTANLAAGHFRPHYKIDLDISVVPTYVPTLATEADAVAWLESERANLVAAAWRAADLGWHNHAWQIPYQLWRFFYLRGRIHEWIATNQIALAAAQAAEEIAGQVAINTSLASAHLQICQYQPAIAHGRAALRLNERHGDQRLEAHNRNGLGIAYTDTGQYREAIECYQRAHELFTALDMASGMGGTLHNLSRPLTALGRYPEAIEHNEQALALFRKVGDHNGEALTLGALAGLHGATGRHAAALTHARTALDLARQHGDRGAEGHYLNIVAVAHRRAGNLDSALTYHEEAVEATRRVDGVTGELAVLNDAGVTLRLAGKIAESLNHHRRALAIAKQSGYRHEEARALDGMGHALTGRDASEAKRCREAAARIYAELGVPAAGDEPTP